jgi:hypothetical protein
MEYSFQNSGGENILTKSVAFLTVERDQTE